MKSLFPFKSGSGISDEEGLGDIASGSEASYEGGGTNSGRGSGTGSASGSGEKMTKEEEEKKVVGEEEDEECADALTTDEGEGDDITHSTAYTATTCSLLCMEYMVNNSEYEVTNSYIVCQHFFTLLGNLYSYMAIKMFGRNS